MANSESGARIFAPLRQQLPVPLPITRIHFKFALEPVDRLDGLYPEAVLMVPYVRLAVAA